MPRQFNMKTRLAALLLAPLALAGCADAEPAPDGAGDGWQLVWADEFDGESIDTSRWTVLNDCWGGGNEERQCYTPRPENVTIEEGNLVITAHREDWAGPAFPASFGPADGDSSQQASKPFTSGKLTTQGNASWTYGRFEIRARLPGGQGVWPAFWMLPEESVYGSWAASGEIDILETVNLGVVCDTCEEGGENTILGTLHFGGQWPDNDLHSTEVSMPEVLDGAFHTYGVIWERGRFFWTFDGEVYATAEAGDWFTTASSDPHAPFDQPFHLIVNLAIGGGLPEGRALMGVAEDNFPKRMEIDWVRVWQCEADAATGRGCTGGM
ncbi:glycoside hydrolase family 16 protein [Aurantiacibacter gilvus]|uniref:Glycoside hydrolase family 16 protein n=1 Tax=Aurantiacibacter gilvus TaxID=3139141 RepID=A0ABU9IG34_9SPHN